MFHQDHTDAKAQERFHKIFCAQYECMLRYAKAIFRSRGAPDSGDGRSEDAVQEAFAFAWKHRDEMFESPNPEGWLFKTLSYKVLEQLKEENNWFKKIRRLEQAATLPADPLKQVDIDIRSLVSDNDYKLLKKLYLDGYSYAEVCSEYGLSKAALTSRIHRIKQRLRKILNE